MSTLNPKPAVMELRVALTTDAFERLASFYPVVTPWGDHNVRLQDPDGMQITLFQTLDQGGS